MALIEMQIFCEWKAPSCAKRQLPALFSALTAPLWRATIERIKKFFNC